MHDAHDGIRRRPLVPGANAFGPGPATARAGLRRSGVGFIFQRFYRLLPMIARARRPLAMLDGRIGPVLGDAEAL